MSFGALSHRHTLAVLLTNCVSGDCLAPSTARTSYERPTPGASGRQAPTMRQQPCSAAPTKSALSSTSHSMRHTPPHCVQADEAPPAGVEVAEDTTVIAPVPAVSEPLPVVDAASAELAAAAAAPPEAADKEASPGEATAGPQAVLPAAHVACRISSALFCELRILRILRQAWHALYRFQIRGGE